jgi:cytidylate kinase
MTVVLIAGEIASGKSTVARGIVGQVGGELVQVRLAMARVLGLSNPSRQRLQEEGASLDRRTSGRWLLDYLEEQFGSADVLVVDSMRTRKQTLPVLERLTDTSLVYLDALPGTRRQRFALSAMSDPVKQSMSFSAAMEHPTEVEVRRLRPMADLVITTDDLDAAGVIAEILSAVSR